MIVKLLSRSYRACLFAAAVLEARSWRHTRRDNPAGPNAGRYRVHSDLGNAVRQWRNYYQNRAARRGR